MKKKIFIISTIIITILLVLSIIVLKLKKEIKENNEKENEEVTYIDGEFTLNLIKAVNENKKENYLISPYSIELALNMLREGASGNTLNELNSALGNRNINNSIIKDRISIANAVFIKNKYKPYILSNYYNKLKKNYDSEILYDNFKTPKVINDWVNEKTYGMIDNVINRIDDNFILGIVNAIAIDVKWNIPFDCSSTTSETFNQSESKNMQVEMMHKSFKNEGYKYLENDNATGVIIPYKKYNTKGEEVYSGGNNLEFIAILPKDNILDYINNLTNAELSNLESSAMEASNNFEINLSLPRFKYDYNLDNFKEVLNKLGIISAFNSENADFTKIIPRNSNIENVYVGDAVHKTHIDLNENGTKAAAVTFFGMYSSTAIQENESINIVFNKPFIYMIRDAKTKEMLFFGTVYEPNKWNGNICVENNN